MSEPATHPQELLTNPEAGHPAPSPEESIYVYKPGVKTTDDPAPKPPKPAPRDFVGQNRPPCAPEKKILGPYLQFSTTDNATHTWYGSALILYKNKDISTTPKLAFDHEFSEQVDVDVLYKDIVGYTALRYNLAFHIPDGVGDEVIKWELTHEGFHESAAFSIPKWEQPWRGAFFSCSGFDAYVPEGVVTEFGFENVWRHLNSVHEQTPMHLMIWGGDQIYSDAIFEDIPFLERWVKLDWDVKWKHEFSHQTGKYVAEYYFFSYLETWERKEVNKAIRTSPALMVWDDHDIFDGAGSYPPELHDSPVMLGLFESANVYRLLFQHHTTPKLANTKHKFFGYKAQNHIAQLGPKAAILMPDGRSERDWKQVHDKKSIDMIFERLNSNAVAQTTQHLIVAFAIPFSFIRVPAAEAIFEFLKDRAPWVRKLPFIKSTNSIFDLPEFYDDLLDEWCHESHINERNEFLVRLQKFAETRSIRVTFLSGDVHCAGFARFRSDKAAIKANNLIPATDSKLMYQAIASAIVNASPSPMACIGYHYIGNKWHPVADTEEKIVEFFERRPEGGKHVRHRKFMPNRNWLFFEFVGAVAEPGQEHKKQTPNGDLNYVVNDNDDSSVSHQKGQRDHHHLRHLWHGHSAGNLSMLDWSRHNYFFDRKHGYPSTLGPTSSPDGLGMDHKPNHKHHHGPFCHHKKSKEYQKEKIEEKAKIDEGKGLSVPTGDVGLKLRIWLESRNREGKGRQFSSYELVIPELNVGPAKVTGDQAQAQIKA